MSARYDAIDHTLRKVRAALRVNDLVLGLGWMTLSVAVVLLAGFWLALLDVHVSSPLLLGTIALVFLAAFGLAILPFLRRLSDEVLAQRIGERFPTLGDRFLSAVQLHRDADTLSSRYALSRELIDLHVDATAEHTVAVELSRLVEWKRTLKLLGVSAVLMLLAVILPMVVPGIAFRMWALAIGLRPVAPVTAAVVAGAAPRLGDVTVTYHYPDYTGRAPETFEGTDGNLKALKGTVAQISLRADRAVKKAQITLNGKESLKLEVRTSAEGGTSLAGEVPLLENGSWTVEAEGATGIAAADKATHTITVEEDRVPNVQILWPVESETDVNELEDVTITWGAEDDFGLKSVELVWENHPPEGEIAAPKGTKTAKAAGKIPLISFSNDKPPLRHGDQYKWALSSLSLKPGGYVEYWVEATDNDTVSGPKKGRSQKHILRLLSSSEIHDRAVAMQEEILKRMIHLLGDHLDLDAHPPAKEKVSDEAERLEGRATELTAAFDKLTTEMLKDPLGDETVYKQIVRIRADLADIAGTYAARSLAEATRGSPDPATSRRDAFAGARADAVPTIEKDTLFLDKMIEKQRFDGARQELVSLAKEQKDLRSMLDQYKKGGIKDADLAKALEQRLAAIQERMQAMAQKMASTMKSMPSDFDNSAMQDDLMTQIQKAIEEGRMDDAAALTEQLLNGLDQMAQQMDNVEKQFNLDPETAQKLTDAQKELGKIAEDQKKLTDDTAKIRDQIQKRADESGKKVDEFVKKEQEKVAKLRNDLDALQRQGMLDPAMRQIVNSARFGMERDLKSLEDSLKSGELGEGLNDAQQIQSELDSVERAPESLGMNRPGDQPNASTMEAANKADNDARGIVKDLEQLRQQFEESATPDERQKLSQMGQGQQKLQGRAQGLAEQMREMSQKSPFIPGEAGQAIADAGQAMGDASGKMKGGNAAGAVPSQRDASEKLGQAQQQMQGSGQSGRSSGMPLAQRMGQGQNRGQDGMRGFSNEKVEIPDGSQFRVPREFREDILEAMKKPSPDGYKQLNQEYYERLIK